MQDFRNEKDTMGTVQVPEWAYWGAHTQRAIDNFNVSDIRLPKPIISALLLVKQCAAQVNEELGILEPRLAKAIVQAAEELQDETWDKHFPVDVFQTGSGTSSNMNVNEVIANRANELLGSSLGSKHPVHPNDHVNLGQSSNDVFPTAIHIAVRLELDFLRKVFGDFQGTLFRKSEEFADIVKVGRTHLQDAVPMTLGQEFSGYASQINHGIKRLEQNLESLEELALGGTAVGTGLNAHPEFAARVIEKIRQHTNIPFRVASNRFEALASRDELVAFMGVLNSAAVALMKIANDIRLLSSGPHTGFGEIALPPVQPGSSIMPGKINPVMAEMMIQVSAQVMGNHLTVTIGGQNAPLELNMMMPMIAYNVLFSIEILTRGVRLFNEKCVSGIQANAERCSELVEQSLALVTPLALRIGYERAAAVAQKASREKKTLREIILEEGILTEEETDEILNPRNMLGPNIR